MTYTRTEAGTFVPTDDPNSLAKKLSAHAIYLNYESRDWSIVAAMAGTPDSAPPQTFHLHKAGPPRTEIRLTLKNDRRSLHSLREEGTACITGDFQFTISCNDEGATEGFIRHTPAWEAKHSEDSASEGIHGGISVPKEQFDWLLDELSRPNARLHLRLIAPLYKEAIAHSFDEPWMIQDIYVPYDQVVILQGFDFTVVHGPQMPAEREQPLGEFDDPTTVDEPLPEPPAPPAPDQRLTWITVLLAILIAVELWRGAG